MCVCVFSTLCFTRVNDPETRDKPFWSFISMSMSPFEVWLLFNEFNLQLPANGVPAKHGSAE